MKGQRLRFERLAWWCPELGPYWETMMRKNTSGAAEALREARRRALRDAADILRSWLVVNETHPGEDLEGVPPDEWAKAGMLDCIQQISDNTRFK
jgi:hypothetical protein